MSRSGDLAFNTPPNNVWTPLGHAFGMPPTRRLTCIQNANLLAPLVSPAQISPAQLCLSNTYVLLNECSEIILGH